MKDLDFADSWQFMWDRGTRAIGQLVELLKMDTWKSSSI